MIVELNGSCKKYGYSDEDVHQYIISKGFTPVLYNPFERRIMPMSSYNKEGFNTIYIRNPEIVERELYNAPAIKVGRFYI